MKSIKCIILVLVILLSGKTSISQTREGWVKGNADTLIYLSGIYDFNSSEVKTKTSAAEQDEDGFKYYLGDVVDYSSINGLMGLLVEWGASNAELSTQLSSYDAYLNKALQKGALVEQQGAFTSENSFIRVVRCRHYFLKLLKFASIYKKDIYQKNLANPSFCKAFSMCDRASRELIDLRTKKINQLIRDLNINHIEAKWENGYFLIGDVGLGTFDEEMKPLLKAYQDNEIKKEFLSASKKITTKQRSSITFVKTNMGRFTSDRSKADFFLTVSQIASPSAYAILSNEPNISAYTKYAPDTSLVLLFKDFNTVVHETCHTANFNTHYFISESITIPVISTDIYNSHELIKVIPKEKYQSFFRNTYIFEESETSSQVNGIFGLLNEFSAYYNGSKADWDILTNKEKIIQKFRSYKEGIQELTVTTWDAYYEFSVMMAWYLDYSRLQYPDQYKLLMSNKALRVAYTLLDNRFGELVNKIEVKLGSADKNLKALFDESTKTLNRFKIENCNEANYKKFL